MTLPTAHPDWKLNFRALQRVERLLCEADVARVVVTQLHGGGRIIDCGCMAPGGLAAGLALAEICLAGLGQVRIVPGRGVGWPPSSVEIWSDQPVIACLAAQYAGWKLTQGKFFAMGSGPMRAACAREEIFTAIGFSERAPAVCGVLETRKSPPSEIVEEIAAACGVAPAQVTLLVARTASQAGTLQVIARSLETALHKLHELGFDVTTIESGYGVAPMMSVAGDDLTAIGRTNDAVLYGGEVTLWLRGDDAQLAELGPKIPSNASPEFGRPFLEIFELAGRDFYAIDPLLFSPARVTLVNLTTGRTHTFGELMPTVLGTTEK